jgi:rhodanese-related sulfurtransferase
MFGFFKSDPIKAIAPKEAHARAEKGEIRLVDVRETREWSQMRIPGALHAPLSEFAKRLPDLPRDKPLVFYCLSGNQSRTAVQISRKLGLPHDTDMTGGITAWRAAGFSVEK